MERKDLKVQQTKWAIVLKAMYMSFPRADPTIFFPKNCIYISLGTHILPAGACMCLCACVLQSCNASIKRGSNSHTWAKVKSYHWGRSTFKYIRRKVSSPFFSSTSYSSRNLSGTKVCYFFSDRIEKCSRASTRANYL